MPKFDKPDSPNIIWGVNALDADLTRPDDSYIQTGWTQVKPPYEYENYSMNKLYQGFAYYNQLGFPEWDSVTEYQAGKSYVQGSNNRVYKCIQTHANRNPATSGNEAWWEIFEGNRQATTSARGTLTLATDNEARQGKSTTTSITPSNLLNGLLGTASLGTDGNFKVPVKVGNNRVDVMVQWGSRGNLASGDFVNFHTPFSNQTFKVLLTDQANSDDLNDVEIISVNNASVNKDGFRIYGRRSDGQLTNSTTINYLAIGY